MAKVIAALADVSPAGAAGLSSSDARHSLPGCAPWAHSARTSGGGGGGVPAKHGSRGLALAALVPNSQRNDGQTRGPVVLTGG